MFEKLRSRPAQALGLLASGIDALLDQDLADLDDRELVDLMTRLEAQARRLPAVNHRLVAALEERRVARRRGLRDTAALLRRELRVSAGEARARVDAAGALAGTRGETTGADATGEVVPPALPVAAAAQSRGELSAAQARVIQQSVEQIPTALRDTKAAELEETLTREARELDPYRLAQRARQLLVEIDPDRVRRQEQEQQRLRAGSFVRNPDGSSDVRAHLTPVGTAIFEAAILPLTAPQPDDLGGRDEREPQQRFHDGLVEGWRRLLAAKEVPGEGGVPATVLLIVPLAELNTQTGTARTQYGTVVSIGELLRLAGEATVVPVVVDERGSPLHVGRARRFATRAQTHALIVRDKGCSFPDCDHPPPWTQRHHILAWLHGGLTDIDNLTLLCPYHHANFAGLGWECRIIDGMVHWVPPARIDPARRPIRNTRHDRVEDEFTSPGGERAA